MLCRSSLEKAIFWLYQNDEDLELPYDTKLGALLHNDSFKAILKPSMLMELDIVRLYGNNAAHGKNIRALEALQALKNSFRFLSWLSKYYSQENPEIADFDERLIPYGDVADKTKKELQALTEQFDKEREQANKLAKKQAVLAEENEKLKQQLEAQLQIIASRKEERSASIRWSLKRALNLLCNRCRCHGCNRPQQIRSDSSRHHPERSICAGR